MSEPIRLHVAWARSLYDRPLAERVSAVLDEEPDTLAIVNSITTSRNGIDTLWHLYGHERLARVSGRRIHQEVRVPRGGLLGQIGGHGYRVHVPYPDTGAGFRIYLHRRCALVLPADPALRRKRRHLEDGFSRLILPRPDSAHGWAMMRRSLPAIAAEAGDLFAFAWRHGLALVDPMGHLPEPFPFFPDHGS